MLAGHRRAATVHLAVPQQARLYEGSPATGAYRSRCRRRPARSRSVADRGLVTPLHGAVTACRLRLPPVCLLGHLHLLAAPSALLLVALVRHVGRALGLAPSTTVTVKQYGRPGTSLPGAVASVAETARDGAHTRAARQP
jgi:hypothetical protein